MTTTEDCQLLNNFKMPFLRHTHTHHTPVLTKCAAGEKYHQHYLKSLMHALTFSCTTYTCTHYHQCWASYFKK